MENSGRSDIVRLAIPSKGRISQPVRELVERSGLHISNGDSRRLVARTLDPHVEILFARPIDIPSYVENGAADLGITGRDMIAERKARVIELLELGLGEAHIVVAVPENAPYRGVKDLQHARVATEFPAIASSYFSSQHVETTLVPVSGACEVTPQLGIADAIVDLTSSGTTLKTHNLRVLAHILHTVTVLIGNEGSLLHKKDKMEEIRLALESVVRARGQCYLMMNARRDQVEEIKSILPGLSGPTVMPVASSEDLVAVHVVVEEERIYQLIGQLKRAGARDILVMPIERMIR
ncbi:MAG: ATP phosphoribosyltransferase [Methanomicrobiales archaeon]|nr:ATP phosphoribosyltransferase [Methanomicrobiales archaeon]